MIRRASLVAIFRRDILLGWRGAGDILAGLVFFAIIIALVPLALGPDAAALARIAPAILWIGILISTLPQMERLFARDAAEGALDHLIMTPAPLPLIILAKAGAAWILIGLPMTIFAPVMGVMLGLTFEGIGAVLAALAMGSFALTQIGMLAASLVLGARRSGILMAVLVLPLAMPILIFGTALSAAAMAGEHLLDFGDAFDALQLLAGITLILTATLPPLTAISLRQAAEQG
jgi:heme exporter protein B